MRDALGLDPYDNPAADRPMVLTATGYVPIEAGGEGGDSNPNRPGIDKEVGAPSALSPWLAKYGYNPEEPRNPKGKPGGGQWTEGAIHLAQDDSSGVQSDAFPPYRGRGHTWVPTAVYNKYKWKEETENIFKSWTSGQLADPSMNDWSPEHDAYNDGVDDLIKSYLNKQQISSEDATEEQAKEIVEEVLGSSDPRIRELRTPVLRQALR
jgi:hypothetical protein